VAGAGQFESEDTVLPVTVRNVLFLTLTGVDAFSVQPATPIQVDAEAGSPALAGTMRNAAVPDGTNVNTIVSFGTGIRID
jgi:hypothetical protein